MTDIRSIKQFTEYFKGRQDVVPRYWTSARTGRSGYSPLCRNEWNRAKCQKGDIRSACSECKHADYLPLSESLIRRHFTGKHILGIYPLLPDHTCYFIAADFDNHKQDRRPLEDVKNFYEVCRMQEIPCYMLRSKSGKGYHGFIFFESPVPARKARRIAFALLQESEIIGGDMQLSSFDRLFPNQDRLSGKGFGNLIALPFQGNAAKKGHTLFLDPDSGFTKPYKNQWRVLAGIQKNEESVLNDLIKAWTLDLPDSGSDEIYENSRTDAHYPVSDFERIAAECAFVAHCRDDAENLSEPDWYILLTISARCRDGQRLSHKLSASYPNYSPRETDAKIYNALHNTGPYRCQTISRINSRYCKDCKYFGRITSPIILGWKNAGPRKFPMPDELTKEEAELIRKYHEFYRSLDQGIRTPVTKAQEHFTRVCRGRRLPRTCHESAYLKYKMIRAKQKFRQYESPEIPANKPGIKEIVRYYGVRQKMFKN
jgi:uncharacterized protein YifE (UPF0438 family)